MSSELVVVTGAGGFIGGHLVGELLKKGHKVRAVDHKSLDDWWQKHPSVENLSLDLDKLEHCHTAAKGAKQIYNLAADMGFIEHNKTRCMWSVDGF